MTSTSNDVASSRSKSSDSTQVLISKLVLQNPVRHDPQDEVRSSSGVQTTHYLYGRIVNRDVSFILLNERYLWSYNGDFTKLATIRTLQLNRVIGQTLTAEYIRKYQDRVIAAIQATEGNTFVHSLTQHDGKNLSLKIYRNTDARDLLAMIPFKFIDDTSESDWSELVYSQFTKEVMIFHSYLHRHCISVMTSTENIEKKVADQKIQLRRTSNELDEWQRKKRKLECDWIEIAKMLVLEKDNEINRLEHELKLHQEDLAELQAAQPPPKK